MTEYDKTNTGVFFPPHDNQSLVGQGNLNVNGRDDRIAILREPIKRDGEPQLVVYKKIGVLFPNEKKGNDRAPDYSGPIDALSLDMRLAAWKGEKDGRPYMSLKAQSKQSASSSSSDTGGGAGGLTPPSKGGHRISIIDDDIPF